MDRFTVNQILVKLSQPFVQILCVNTTFQQFL